jgi:hypothetical protein
VASTAIARLLRGCRRDLRVLAVFPQAIYLDVGDDLVTLVTSDGIRHPNALSLNLSSSLRPFWQVRVGQAGRIGNGGLRVGDLEIRVSRWWDPAPMLRASTPDALRAASGITRRRIGAPVDGMLPSGDAGLDGASGGDRDVDLSVRLAGAMAGTLAALAVGDDTAALAAAGGSIGLGPGLTPSGDDRLAGLIAGTLVLAPSLDAGASAGGGAGGGAGVGAACGGGGGGPGHELPGRAAADLARVVATTQRFGRAVAQAAVGRTTSVSAALLVHAALGRLADPATVLVRSWTSSAGLRVASLPAQMQATRNPGDVRDARAFPADADIVRATDRLLAVGSSSGRDLTLGLLAAVDLLTGAHAGSTPPLPAMPRDQARPHRARPAPTSPRTDLAGHPS